DHCIAEYDGDGDLLRKYIYGPGIDEPICMIDVNDSNAVYYYHFDALGSVVALSDADGDTVQVYEYDVYGQVAASDPNHTNPFLFTGRRFDGDTGLYYYRARYYNPYIGRFLQTDPIGYADGMNCYTYCYNNPTIHIDPSGCIANGDPKKHDPNLRVVFYDGATYASNAADDEYFHYRFDLGDAGEMTRADYIVHIINTIGDWYEGTYNLEKQVTIDGVWILSHGGANPPVGAYDPIVWICLGDTDEETYFADDQKTKDFFSSLGQALDDNGGEDAVINLRSCEVANWNPDGTKQSPMLETAVRYSGHDVTGNEGDIWFLR
ncbi:hypothetical protein GF356_01575, partial [candidate division GN15 bacterium]|nr:hypothetical protein [candidate division GN15 bacterium]